MDVSLTEGPRVCMCASSRTNMNGCPDPEVNPYIDLEMFSLLYINIAYLQYIAL